MSSADTRIKLEARLRQDRRNAEDRERDSRLELLLTDEMVNMKGRNPNGDAAWLRNKSYDESFHDYGYKAKRYRTRIRIENLLKLCDGDKELLLRKYALVLWKYFPISQKGSRWRPQLVTAQDGRLTIIHKWGRVPKPKPA